MTLFGYALAPDGRFLLRGPPGICGAMVFSHNPPPNSNAVLLPPSTHQQLAQAMCY